MCTLLHILYILYTYIIRIVQSLILHPSLVGLMIPNAIHSATVLLYHTLTHPHYRILMGHSVSFLPHLPRHPPSLLRPYIPHLPTGHSKLPLVMNNSQQFLLDFTHTHTQTVNKHTHVCNVCVLRSVASKNLCDVATMCMIVAGYLYIHVYTLVHEGFQHMYSLVVRSTFSLIRCTHTHSLAHTRHTHTHRQRPPYPTDRARRHIHPRLCRAGPTRSRTRMLQFTRRSKGHLSPPQTRHCQVQSQERSRKTQILGRFLRSLPHLCGHTERGGVCMGIEQLWTTVHWRQ